MLSVSILCVAGGALYGATRDHVEEGIRRGSRRLIKQSGESVSPYEPTPILAMALAASGVDVASVSPAAPKSARALFSSPVAWFGERSASVTQLAIGALGVVGAAAAASQTAPTLNCVQAPTLSQPTSTTSSSQKQTGKQNREELQFEEALIFFLANWRDDWLRKVLGGSESAARTSEHAAAIGTYDSKLLSMEGEGVCICASV